MLRNTNLHFICKYVHIKTENTQTPFTNLCGRNQVLKIPIAHNEGNYYIDKAGLESLENNSPNGALANIAGIINKEGNVLGMMPHPERSSERELGSQDGLLIFASIVQWVESRA